MSIYHPGTDLASAYNLPFPVEKIEEPEKVYFEMDGIAVASFVFKKAGHVALQHVHSYDHGTFVARGVVDVYKKDKVNEFKEGEWIWIEANVPHAIVAKVDNCMVWCAHNADRHPEVKESI